MIYEINPKGTTGKIANFVNNLTDEEIKEALNIILRNAEIKIKKISKEEKRKLEVIYNIKSGILLFEGKEPIGQEIVKQQENIAIRELKLLQKILKEKNNRELLIDLLIFTWDEKYYLHGSSIYSDIVFDDIINKRWGKVRETLHEIIREYAKWI